MDITTPALLFPAVSLLLLAYTNRFLALAALIRSLYEMRSSELTPRVRGQLQNLRLRVVLIRNMQGLGMSSLLFCVVSMFLIFMEWMMEARVVFGLSLVLLIASLGLSVWEIQISVRALDLELEDLERDPT
ncbi:MAG: DUF2721 domain-containing protein [Myxococcota bacterium]|nr:DUF2721 domain-containing protein [Myxococcota bacterium]